MVVEPVENQRSTEEWRNHIAEAAREVFQARGLVGAKTREIAKAAGVKESLLWTHFQTKDEIFSLAVLSLLARDVATMLENLDFRAAETEESRAQVIDTAQQCLLSMMNDIMPLLGVALFSRPEVGAEFYRERLVPLVEQWLDRSGAGVQGWPHLAEDLWTIFNVLWGAHFGLALSSHVYGRELDVSRAASHVGDLLRHGLAGEAGGDAGSTNGVTRKRRKRQPVTRYDIADGVATITLGTSPRGGALDAEVLNALGDDLVQAEGDGDVRVVVLSGSDDVLVSTGVAQGRGSARQRHTLEQIVTRLVGLPKPVVGRIAGDCAGAGVALAAACDISVVADGVHLTIPPDPDPELVAAFAVSLSKLQRADALELLLVGGRISAKRAESIRLVNQVVPRTALDTSVENVIGTLLSQPPKTLATYKSIVTRGASPTVRARRR